MARNKILVVEDEEDIQELVCYNLIKEGYEVCCAAAGEEALRIAGSESPDLILLDLMLPGIDGLEVCELLRADDKTRETPIIMLTARGEESDVVTGLELGADDYITKPFAPRVLAARIRALLRRTRVDPVEETSKISIRDVVIHPGRHEVLVGGMPITLTSTEFQVLHVLTLRPGWVLTRRQISEAVHGNDYLSYRSKRRCTDSCLAEETWRSGWIHRDCAWGWLPI